MKQYEDPLWQLAYSDFITWAYQFTPILDIFDVAKQSNPSLEFESWVTENYWDGGYSQ